MRCRRCCQTSRCADGHVAASRLTRSGTLLTHANGQGKSRKRLEQESLGATGMLWLLLQCGCCCSAATNTVALLLLLLAAKHGQDVYLAGQMLPPSLAPRIAPDSCDRRTECTECCNHVCSECLVALPRPIGANADLIDDYYGFYTCCLCCSA